MRIRNFRNTNLSLICGGFPLGIYGGPIRSKKRDKSFSHICILKNSIIVIVQINNINYHSFIGLRDLASAYSVIKGS